MGCLNDGVPSCRAHLVVKVNGKCSTCTESSSRIRPLPFILPTIITVCDNRSILNIPVFFLLRLLLQVLFSVSSIPISCHLLVSRLFTFDTSHAERDTIQQHTSLPEAETSAWRTGDRKFSEHRHYSLPETWARRIRFDPEGWLSRSLAGLTSDKPHG